jgi:hypothetical protein
MKPRLKRVLKGAGVSIAVLFVGVTLVGLFLPTTLHVERSIVVGARPEDIYPLIADFKTGWKDWSPFENESDDMQMRYEGPEIGVGAQQSWTSAKMGDGHMMLTQADPQKGVSYDLSLMHDAYRLEGSLVCAPASDGTRVTWVDDIAYGSNPYRRYMGVLIKKPLGDAFDKGLAALKRKAEARSAATSGR